MTVTQVELGNGLVARALSKPVSVIVFRLYQAIILMLMARCGVWGRVARRAERRYLVPGVGDELPVVIHPARPELTKNQQRRLHELAQAVTSSQFSLFGENVPNLSNCDFAVDWRFDHHWPPRYFKSYRFYEEKKIPYDVKFPWELSRLHYLVPVLANELVSGCKESTLRWVLDFLRRWRDGNPLAHSVNWYPMEASMRLVSLVLLADLGRLLRGIDLTRGAKDALSELGAHLRLMIREHGDFVWMNREFTDVRGNHFTANLVALLLASQSLNVGAPKRWQRYAEHWLDKEVDLQFSEDGVNFEKSCGYHKLVLELFVLATIVRERAGTPFDERAINRLIEATRYSDAITRPDGFAANFGDSDDAIALPFIFDRPRSHGAVIELVRAWFEHGVGSQSFDEDEALTAMFIAGKRGPIPTEPKGDENLMFPHGGYAIVRNASNGFFCMMDVGEVGMGGRGGHGHNDLLAFELCIDGHPVVVDPGCSGYTADLAKKTRYRSTGAHATVQLYGEEIARFAGHWGIHNDAQPIDVSASQTEEGALIQAGHEGYARFAVGTRVTRSIDVNAKRQSIFITDEICCSESDVGARWHFPLGDGVNVEVHGQKARINSSSASVIAGSCLHFTSCQKPYSAGYGREATGLVLATETRLSAGSHIFNFSFQKQMEVGA